LAKYKHQLVDIFAMSKVFPLIESHIYSKIPINQSVTSVGDPINEYLICRPVLG